MDSGGITAVNREERRRALLVACVAVFAIGLVDLLARGATPLRVGLWGGWIVAFLGLAALLRAAPRWIPALVSTLSSAIAIGGLHVLAVSGAGSRDVVFAIVTSVPLLSVAFSPENTEGAALQGVLVLAGGVALLLRDGRPPGDVATWAAFLTVATALALFASVRYRRRIERAFSERSGLAERLVAAERERQQADRWIAVGKLADGVAHDVNNPLGSMRANLAFVREEIAAGRAADPEVDEALRDCLDSLERIRETVASLRAISVGDAEQRERAALRGPDGGAPGAPRRGDR